MLKRLVEGRYLGKWCGQIRVHTIVPGTYLCTCDIGVNVSLLLYHLEIRERCMHSSPEGHVPEGGVVPQLCLLDVCSTPNSFDHVY